MGWNQPMGNLEHSAYRDAQLPRLWSCDAEQEKGQEDLRTASPLAYPSKHTSPFSNSIGSTNDTSAEAMLLLFDITECPS